MNEDLTEGERTMHAMASCKIHFLCLQQKENHLKSQWTDEKCIEFTSMFRGSYINILRKWCKPKEE